MSTQSGVGVLGDGARGMYASDKVYVDYPADDIASLPATQNHRDIDMAFETADSKGKNQFIQ
jgi:hypothetical protein